MAHESRSARAVSQQYVGLIRTCWTWMGLGLDMFKIPVSDKRALQQFAEACAVLLVISVAKLMAPFTNPKRSADAALVAIVPKISWQQDCGLKSKSSWRFTCTANFPTVGFTDVTLKSWR